MNVLEKLKAKKALVAALLAMVMIPMTMVVAFAAEQGASGSDLSKVTITTEMLSPLVDGIVANIQVILPVGLGLFAIFLGIRIIPGLISRFTRV